MLNTIIMILTLLVCAVTESAPILEFNAHSSFKTPRPRRNETNVSILTTIYFVVKDSDAASNSKIDPDSVEAFLLESKGESLPMLKAGRKFQAGFDGRVFLNVKRLRGKPGVGIYIKPKKPLKENTRYTVKVNARASDGSVINKRRCSWSFTTASSVSNAPINISLNFNAPAVHWHGQFFAGIMKPNYNTSKLFHQIDSYRMMAEVSRRNPNVWSLQRDWPLTGDFWMNGVWDGNPNLVREKETRRISHITNADGATLLTVEDFYGHEQYGIEDNRPLSLDYHPGDTVLIADRHKSEIATVKKVDDDAKMVTVSLLKRPADSWVVDYPGSIPKDRPETPGNFSLPRCYLRKFKPSGTPVYFWDRIDAEMDIVHKKFGRRLVVNFVSTPVDLSIDGVPQNPGGNGSPNKPKDYLEYWNFVYTVTDHIIKRYGRAAQDFYYSVGNEFDLKNFFWRGTREEVYEFYDYTVDAMLRACEDNGLDSSKVKVGGLEIAGIWGLRTLPEFLYHCSPTAKKKGVSEINYAYANPALKGRRSKRVETLCKANNGEGSPCDFISIHQYKRSKDVAKNLIEAKKIALKIDADYYRSLYVNTFENCPGWIPLPDPAQRSVYRGNGYFPSWAADIAQRLIEKASEDKRYSFGETLLTVWPFDYNFVGMCSVTGLFKIDNNHDGKLDKVITIKKPIFNFIELLGKMSHDYFAIPRREISGYVIGGFGSKKANSRQILLYCHNENDIETRGNRTFRVNLKMGNIPWQEVTVEQFRVDKYHSSVYPELAKLTMKKFYEESEVAGLDNVDDLEKSSDDMKLAVQDRVINLDVTIAANGVTFINIRQ